MSFRYTLMRLVYQLGARAASRDQAARCAGDAAVKSRVQSGARRFSSVGKATGKVVERKKREEEALRTVMFLTMWGPG